VVWVVLSPRSHRQHLLAREAALVLEGHVDQQRNAMPAQCMTKTVTRLALVPLSYPGGPFPATAAVDCHYHALEASAAGKLAFDGLHPLRWRHFFRHQPGADLSEDACVVARKGTGSVTSRACTPTMCSSAVSSSKSATSPGPGSWAFCRPEQTHTNTCGHQQHSTALSHVTSMGPCSEGNSALPAHDEHTPLTGSPTAVAPCSAASQ
jgi:hypothetical protein